MHVAMFMMPLLMAMANVSGIFHLSGHVQSVARQSSISGTVKTARWAMALMHCHPLGRREHSVTIQWKVTGSQTLTRPARMFEVVDCCLTRAVRSVTQHEAWGIGRQLRVWGTAPDPLPPNAAPAPAPASPGRMIMKLATRHRQIIHVTSLPSSRLRRNQIPRVFWRTALREWPRVDLGRWTPLVSCVHYAGTLACLASGSSM